MKGLGSITSKRAVLFTEALLFLVLTRRGVHLALSAGIACVFVLLIAAIRIVYRESRRQNAHWTQVLDIRKYSSKNKKELFDTVVISLIFAGVILLLSYFR